jgi:predicted PurR-regulated permease PerM
MVLRPVTRIWERIHVPRMLGAALTLIMVVGMITFASIQLIGPAQEWISDAPQRLGKIETKVRDLLKPIDKVRQSADQIGRIATGESRKTMK